MATSAHPETRVLHVDDDPAFADLAADILERQRASLVVETATSAAEGSLPRRYSVVISHADAALTNTSSASSPIARRATGASSALPASHQRKACVSRRLRTLFEPATFLLGQRLEERVVHLDLAA